jgi:hypothetical protein
MKASGVPLGDPGQNQRGRSDASAGGGTSGELTELDRHVRWLICQSFVESGDPPSPANLAQSTGLPLLDLERSLERIAVARAIVLAPGSTHVAGQFWDLDERG